MLVLPPGVLADGSSDCSPTVGGAALFYATIPVMRAYLFYTKGDAGEDQSHALAEALTTMQVDTLDLDADSIMGAQEAELYDITTRPSAVVVRDDGAEVQRWVGKLPEASEVSHYVHAL